MGGSTTGQGWVGTAGMHWMVDRRGAEAALGAFSFWHPRWQATHDQDCLPGPPALVHFLSF